MDSVKIKNKSLLNRIADEILNNQIKINMESKKQFANVFFSVVKVDKEYFVYSSSMNKENKVFFKIDSSHQMTERYLLEKSKPKIK